MITSKIDSLSFMKDMDNILNYSLGFIEGIQDGKTGFLDGLGGHTVETLKQYIDSHARSNPQALQHVYEWYQSGSPNARLFDIKYTVSGAGLSINSTFRQSRSIQNGSNTPFYDKAKIMESGVPVTIRPVNTNVLRFENNGETIFTSADVNVANPGGMQAQGSFQKTFDEFFNKYFSQAFLRSSGIAQYLENPSVFKKYLPIGKSRGKSFGKGLGYKWIIGAGGNA